MGLNKKLEIEVKNTESMPALTHKLLCCLIYSARQEQTHFSASPLIEFSFVLNAFSHFSIKKKVYSKVGFCFFLAHMLTVFLHVYPQETDFRAERCFTGFTTEQL